MSNKRRYFSADQKVASIRKHLLEQVPISDICDELKISSNLFYKCLFCTKAIFFTF